MKFLYIIIVVCLLPCIKLHAQLPSSKPMQLDKILAYNKSMNSVLRQTTPASLPSESNGFSKRAKEIILLKNVQETTTPNLNSLPSIRNPDFEAIIKKYKNI